MTPTIQIITATLPPTLTQRAPVGPASTTTAATPSATGITTTKVNVRSGPGTNYDTLGMLNPQDVVSLTGKNETGTWLQIEYASGKDGRGWVAAGYIQAAGMGDLPILTESGAIIGTGTPTGIPSRPTPIVVPAPLDNDSAQAPAINITFSPSTVGVFIYSSDISTPEGDREDWVQFSPYASPGSSSATVYLSLSCSGNGRLAVDLWQNGVPQPGLADLGCDETNQPLTLSIGQAYTIHLYIADESGDLQYVNYTLRIAAHPWE